MIMKKSLSFVNGSTDKGGITVKFAVSWRGYHKTVAFFYKKTTDLSQISPQCERSSLKWN